jgi:hypothetical protein
MLFGWMFAIGYILLSLASALIIYSACVMARRSRYELREKRRDTVSALDEWRKAQLRSLHVAVHPTLLLPRKGSN